MVKTKLFLITAAILLMLSCSKSEDKITEVKRSEYYDLYPVYAEAAGKNEYKTALEYLDKMIEIMPGNPRNYYNIARIHTALGNNGPAIKNLSTSLTLGFGLEAETDSSFLKLKDLPEYKDITDKINKLKLPVNNSQTAFRVMDRELIPEGITYDPVGKHFYLGSIFKCKIVKINAEGNVSDFVPRKQDGLRTVLGMNVDPIKRILYVNTYVDTPAPVDIDTSEAGWAGLFKYDLDTGKLLNKYTIHEEAEPHLFNDLTYNSAGDVFITDSKCDAVYSVNHKSGKVELFVKSEKLIYPNGIAITPDESAILVASLGGVYSINIKTKEIRYLKHPADISLYGIDGMYFYKNSLVTVQNGLMRISRFYLNSTADKVERFELLEFNNPDLYIPTTGVIVKDSFYYIANCALRSFNPDGSLIKESLKDLLINKVELKQ